MMDATKYAPGYYPVPAGYDSWVKKDHIEKAPAWCSVDLRDGNQALIVPMSLEEKLEFFQMLVKIGFKEIEVGFPAASDTEYEFLRTLIEKNMIPEDVTVQVLTQCRDHIIRKTFEAVKGAPRAVIHFYNSTSVAQREQVFHKSKEEIKERSIHLLEMAGIANCEGVYNMFPHELSGGMRQRVMIAMALSCNPKLIIADEPTTALDVTIQAQILDLLRNLKNKINSSIMLITHDLGVIAEMADYVVVMYAGRVVEKGTVEEIFANPAHPYTIGLMASKPVVGKKVDKLYSIPGKVPNPINMPDYCYFKDRCEMQVEKCSGEYPHMIQLSPTHMVSCYRYFDGKVGE